MSSDYQSSFQATNGTFSSASSVSSVSTTSQQASYVFSEFISAIHHTFQRRQIIQFSTISQLFNSSIEENTLRQVVIFIFKQQNLEKLEFDLITTIKLLYVSINKNYWKNNLKLILFFWCVPFYDETAYKDYFINCLINYYLIQDEIVEELVENQTNGNWINIDEAKKILLSIRV